MTLICCAWAWINFSHTLIVVFTNTNLVRFTHLPDGWVLKPRSFWREKFKCQHLCVYSSSTAYFQLQNSRFLTKTVRHFKILSVLAQRPTLRSRSACWDFTLKALDGSGGMAIAAPDIWSCIIRVWSAATNSMVCTGMNKSIRNYYE